MTNNRNLIIKDKDVQIYCETTPSGNHELKVAPCWFVIDKDTDEIVAGGYIRGNSHFPGAILIPRHKDAEAFIDGYNAPEGAQNPHAELAWVTDGATIGQTSIPAIQRTHEDADDHTEAFWKEGSQFKDKKRTPHKKFSELI